jgi:glycosyltransferase involved in cell wall biosynthesis
MVYHGADYPPAERIDKFAKTLTAEGHEVFLVCNNYGKYAVSEERIGDVYTLRLRPTFRSRLINKILKFPVFLNPLWLVQLFLIVRRFRIDAIQVIDLPLAGAAYAVGRLVGVPVIMDMWENYPEALKGWADLDWTRKVFKNPAVARAVELWLTPRMDHIFVVVEEQKERLIDDRVDPERISVVTNAVDIEMFTGAALRHDTPLDAEPGAYKLLYVGLITVERGLDDIVRALRLLRGRMPFIRLYLAGTGSYEPHLKRLIEQEGVGDLVTFTGWVPFEDIQSFMVKSDLCVVPHLNNTFINTTIPNKLFQYMLMGKPVLVSNAKPLARVVRECSSGFVFESGNPEDAAAAIEKAYKAREDKGIGERGKKCVEAKYTWNTVSPPLVRLYDHLQNKARAASHVE